MLPERASLPLSLLARGLALVFALFIAAVVLAVYLAWQPSPLPAYELHVVGERWRMPMKPNSIKVGGDKYRVTVLQVVSEDEHGRPRELRLIREDEKVTLQGGERFLTAYAHAATLDQKRAKA